MARDDREHTFERALARHLRADKPANSGAGTQRCADAEILAAYHERQLAPEEMTFWKQHISSCARCQDILAHVEATHAIPFDAAAQEKDSAVAGAEQKTPVLRIAKSRRSRLRLWTVPAGAIAAALLVWIVLEQKPQQFELAKTQPVTSPQPRAASSSENAQATPQPEAKHESEKPTLPSRARSETGAPGLRPKQSPEPTAPRPSASPVKNERDARALDTFTRSASTFEPQRAQGVVSNRLSELSKKDTIALAPTPPSASQSVQVNAEAADASAEPAASAPQTLARAAKAKAAISSPDLQRQQKQQIQELGGMSRFTQAPMVLMANSKSPAIIVTPNKKVSWRVGRAGSIERTDDAGASWSLQTSGVVNDLISGSAPSDSVCWVVGQLGTILRTIDGGATWTKLQSPVNEDIRSVFAVNPQQATIFTAHGTYQTSDAGATWTKLPPQ